MQLKGRHFYKTWTEVFKSDMQGQAADLLMEIYDKNSLPQNAAIVPGVLGIVWRLPGVCLEQWSPFAAPPPCIENRGIEDNFIFYIEYCFLFVSVMKLR